MPGTDVIYNSLIKKQELSNSIAERLSALNFSDPGSAWDCLVRLSSHIEFERLFPGFFSRLIEDISITFDPYKTVCNLERFSENIYDKNYLYTILYNNDWLKEALLILFSGSQFLTDMLIKDPLIFEYIRNPDTIEKEKTRDLMHRELTAMYEGVGTPDSLDKMLRKFKQMQFLRIGLRDLLNKADLVDTMKDISNVADICLQTSYRYFEAYLIKRFGIPMYKDMDGVAKRCEFCIMGMGKLGGCELNFSSDIDLLYIYSSDEGKTAGGERRISNHEFYVKLATMVTKSIHEITEDGNVFRVDLGLRPEGQSGDITSSIRSYEIYYEAWGQTWERQALIKARTVAGSQRLGLRFLNMASSFIYKKYLDITFIDEIRTIKERINKNIYSSRVDVKDVKLGRGGIREIEFIVQAFQLLYGGRDKALREKNTLSALAVIKEKGYLNIKDANILILAYNFLRRLEHRIQISFGLQTHKIPNDQEKQAILAKKMGIAGDDSKVLSLKLMDLYRHYTSAVQDIYDTILAKKALPEEDDILKKDDLNEISFDEEGDFIGSRDYIKRFSFPDDSTVIEILSLMYKGHSFSHPSSKSKEYITALTHKILQYSSRTPSPLQSLNYMEKFLSQSGSRENLLALLRDNEKVLYLLLLLFGSSNFLSQILFTQPELIDTLFNIEGINSYKNKKTMLHELSSISAHLGYDKFLREIRRYKKGEALRIGMKYIVQIADIDATSEDLTNLAEVCLSVALRMAMQKLKKKYGMPQGVINGRRVKSKFTIIGMGKLGGHEIDFGSDLDLIFVYSHEGTTTGVRGEPSTKIENSFYFTKLCEAVLSIISDVKEYGYVYKVDSRLRPEGKKGVLAVSLEGFKKYIYERGEPWELLAFIKARPVAGDIDTGKELIDFFYTVVLPSLNITKIMFDIKRIRKRMEYELGREKDGDYDVKFGFGGLVDIEFIVQSLQLRYGVQMNERKTKTTEGIDELCAHGYISPKDHLQLISAYRFYRTILVGLRIENQLSQHKLRAAQKSLSRRLKYADSGGSADEGRLISDYMEHTKRVREIYSRLL